MLIAGLASITFRKLSTEEIIVLATDAGLSQIEWGADVHVMPGDIKKASDTALRCADSGIITSTYGSYFRIGRTPDEDIFAVLESASALGAKVVRIWGYDRFITPFDTDEWKSAVESAITVTKAAESYGITLALECHIKTITEAHENALSFLDYVSSDALRCYWQPNQYKDKEYNLSALRALLPHLEAVHVFNWNKTERLSLIYAKDDWKDYVRVIKSGGYTDNVPMLLEFMPDGKAESLRGEAAALRQIIAG